MRSRFGLTLLLFAFACSDSVKHVPVTEILLRLHADSDVRASVKRLRVSVSAQATSGDAWDQPRSLMLDVPERDDFWPVDLPITPRNPDKPPSQFEIVIDALGSGGDALAQERAITNFVAQQQRMLELTVARCAPRAVCEDQLECHGTDCQRCDDGKCSDTSVTKGDSLPPAPKSAKADGSDAPDAGPSSADGGGDAGAADGGGGAGGRAGSGGKATGGTGGKMQAGSGGSGGAGGAGGSPIEIWSTPDVLESSDVSVTGAGGSRNAAGDLVVVWRQDSSFGPYWARRYVDGKWDSDSFNLSGLNPAAGRLDVAAGIDRNGAAQILYSDGQPHTYWLRWQGESSLPAASPPLALGDQSYGYPAMLGVTESGKSAAVWGGAPDQSTQSQPLYVNRYDVSTGWGTPMMIGSTGAQLRGWGADINANGDWVSLLRVGTGTGPNTVESFVSRGGNISTPTGFDVPDALVSPAFVVGVDGDGNALALYLAGPDPQHLRFHWSRLGASDSSWASEMALTPEGAATGDAVKLADKSVLLIAMEGANSGDSLHLMAYRFAEGKGWSAGERISDDFKSEGQDLLVTANTAGAAIVTWSETGTSGDTALVYKRFTSAKSWGDKGTIASFSASASLAAASLNADGRAIVVWSQDQPTGSGADLKWSRSP